MDNMILIDIETGGFQVEDGILEVGIVVVEKNSIVEVLHIGEAEDEELINEGMGAGYIFIEENDIYRRLFIDILSRYDYPIVAHNASFDRKFLVHYGWMNEEYVVYDSIRALKISHPHLFSYSLGFVVGYFGVKQEHSHTALSDVMALFEVLQKANPQSWIPLFKPLPKKFTSTAKSFIERGMKLQGESEVFHGKHMVFTGTSQFPRILMQEIAVACGSTVGNTVNKKTDFLICGEKVGKSKIIKAIELDVPMYDDDWFIDIVFKDLSLEQVLTENKGNYDGKIVTEANSPYKRLHEFEGKKVNVACLSLRMQSKIVELLVGMDAIISKGSNAKNVDYMIYKDGGDYVMLKEANERNIKPISASVFNRMLLN
ncbi:exonuclease [Psychrobacillus insolitus]|uniref:Exonuclease n=2 Tax=Psychrobacillus insolitus TaxID=1461 RepID=A0A2W7PGN9_9BACI|nr:exonuclease [Psychrobacillus insolitus]